GAVHGPRPALRDERHPGVAVVLLEEPAVGARPLPRARSVHPAHEAEEHPPTSAWGGPHYPPGRRVLRLTLGGLAFAFAFAGLAFAFAGLAEPSPRCAGLGPAPAPARPGSARHGPAWPRPGTARHGPARPGSRDR